MGLGVACADAHAVSQLEEPAERLVERVAVDVEDRDAIADVGHPRTGEAVRLQLEGDGVAAHVGPGLDGVRELVRHHDPDRQGPEVLLQLRDQRHAVPGDDVLLGAVQGVLGDVLVVESDRAALWRRRARSVRNEAGDGLEFDAVDLGETVGPVDGEVVEREVDDLVGRRQVAVEIGRRVAERPRLTEPQVGLRARPEQQADRRSEGGECSART